MELSDCGVLLFMYFFLCVTLPAGWFGWRHSGSGMGGLSGAGGAGGGSSGLAGLRKERRGVEGWGGGKQVK